MTPDFWGGLMVGVLLGCGMALAVAFWLEGRGGDDA